MGDFVDKKSYDQLLDDREQRIQHIELLQHALAKKNREIELADYTIKECLKKLSQQDTAYQQLMEQAIAIAQGCTRMIPYNRAEHEEAIKFLASPEVKAFLKEREGA